MKKLILVILSVCFISANLFSQVLPVSIRVKAGVAHLPMTSWKSFGNISHFPTDRYSTSNPIVFGGISIHWRLSEAHSISLGSELIRPRTQFIGAPPQTNMTGDTIAVEPFRVDWKFRAVPLSLGYEFNTGVLKDRFEPVLGVGVALMFSQVNASVVSMPDIHTVNTSGSGKRNGKGYGIDGSVGFHSTINNHFSSIFQVRYRYSDGMYFTDDPGDIKVKFSGFDFSVGIQYRL